MRIKLFLAVLLLLPTLVHTESRQQNLDFIVLLDKSLSMENKIEDVKRFFKDQILKKSVIPGDYLLIILFYGKTELFWDRAMESPEDFKLLNSRLSELKADGRFTDIGAALDFTYDLVKGRKTDRRRHFLLLTDGRQEAPPGSRYRSLDFSIRHPFLESAKNIQKDGWKVQVLGLGTDAEAEKLADDLSGVFRIWSDTQSMLRDRFDWGREDLELVSKPVVFLTFGVPELRFEVRARGLGGPRVLKIESITWDSGSSGGKNLLNGSFEAIFSHEGLHLIRIPLTAGAIEDFVSSDRELVLTFEGDIPLTPARFSPEITSFFHDFLIIPLSLLLVFLSISIIIMTRSLSGPVVKPVLRLPTSSKAASVEFSENC